MKNPKIEELFWSQAELNSSCDVLQLTRSYHEIDVSSHLWLIATPHSLPLHHRTWGAISFSIFHHQFYLKLLAFFLFSRKFRKGRKLEWILKQESSIILSVPRLSPPTSLSFSSDLALFLLRSQKCYYTLVIENWKWLDWN